ncbi:hypothetical protein LOTGIDRAFT_237352 [Lottia gigantea]|uniref:Sulfhydryl oxidase n=1 Tax=Lottia gigantea TaxID=225164 RepID=V4AJZ2_LOTGI|nr:hypothetical protein LOTGIDRAFT_237352 [Lottia gigantea]ESP04514.1 hypothetical protein LOTGIDRAFT_237352 [Lottia gigantea]
MPRLTAIERESRWNGSVCPSEQGLYTRGDGINVLTTNNFADVVFKKGRNSTWLIQFYNSWCGHCRRYAPKYKKLAKDIEGWSKVMSLGVVDCSDNVNTELCRKYDIAAYPTIKNKTVRSDSPIIHYILLCKFFPLNVSPNKTKMETVPALDPNELRLTLSQIVNNLHLKKRHKSWPKLKPLRSIEEIWEEAKSEHKHVILIFEEQNSLLGVQLILDYMTEKKVLLRRLLKETVVKYGINKIPSLYVVNTDGTYNHIASGIGVDVDTDTDRTTFREAINNLMKNNFKTKEENKVVINKDGKVEIPESIMGAGDGPKDDDVKIKEIEKPQVYLQDLESALHYSFRQEIAICKEISGDKLAALQNFVSVLSKYLPGRDEIKRFLQQVSDWLTTVTTVISGGEWVHGIDNLQDEMAYLPETTEWRGCKGSEPHYRGYPCSMWTLFHTLTVNAYLSDKVVDNQEVLKAIKGYMEYFFGCAECSTNFLQMAKTIESEINNKKDMVLWLWSAHNKANIRLHGDLSEDPQYPKIQFPSPDACPKCFELGSKPWSPKYRNTEVLNFIVEMYSGENLVKTFLKEDKEKTLLRSKSKTDHRQLDWWEKKQRQQDLKQLQNIHKQKHDRIIAKAVDEYRTKNYVRRQKIERHPHGMPGRTSWGLSTVDLGMCFAFYVICAVIVLMLYYHFTIRTKRKTVCKFLPV